MYESTCAQAIVSDYFTSQITNRYITSNGVDSILHRIYMFVRMEVVAPGDFERTNAGWSTERIMPVVYSCKSFVRNQHVAYMAR